MNDCDLITIRYNGQEVLVTREVADFLKEDDRRLKSQKRSDKRRLCYSMALVSKRGTGANHLLNSVIRDLELERLHEAISKLPPHDRALIEYRYYDEFTVQRIAKIFGLSKMAVSKRLKKLHRKLRAELSAS